MPKPDMAMPQQSQFRALFALGAALTVPVLAILSWTPGEYMVRTGVLSGHAEHTLAYCLAAAALMLALAGRVPPLVLAMALVTYAGLLEIGQNLVPERTPALADFAASSLGVLLGLGAVWLVQLVRQKIPRALQA